MLWADRCFSRSDTDKSHMNILLKTLLGVVAAFGLLIVMVRTSGLVLVPIGLLFVGLLLYVGYDALGDTVSPYSRLDTGVFEQTNTEALSLSAIDACESCTDTVGAGVRETTRSELVFLGAPLAVVGRTSETLCELCADPLAAQEKGGAIDDALEREAERN